MRPELAPRLNITNRLTTQTLPWAIGAFALAFYLVTLDNWVSFSNMGGLVDLNGWDWQPQLSGPVFYLLTLPLRLLPPWWTGVGLNVLSALAAALTLVLLAKTVAMIPVESPVEYTLLSQPRFAAVRAAWAPQVFAATLLGTQFTFWEHATSGTGHMLNVLVLAAVAYCTVKANHSANQSRWLYGAAFLMGAGIANYWGMFGYLPLFLIAVIWVRKLRFFSPTFLLKAAGAGLAGLALVLVLPVLHTVTGAVDAPLWQSIRNVLAGYKNTVIYCFQLFYWGSRETAMVLCLTTLLPLLVMAIRWRAFITDTSRLGTAFAELMLHSTHLVLLFLLVCLMFDPTFSPRAAAALLSGTVPFTFLGLYYLCALAIGYFSKYALFMAHTLPVKSLGPHLHRRLRRPPWIRVAGWAALGLTAVGSVFLVTRNAPAIRSEHKPWLNRFLVRLVEPLPRTNAIVLVDDPTKQHLLRAGLVAANRSGETPIILNTRALHYGRYHAWLRREYPATFAERSASLTNEFVHPFNMISLVYSLSTQHSIWYAEPSFGYYFEVFYLEPHGLLYQLKPYGTNALLPPELPRHLMASNVAFWDGCNREFVDELAKSLPKTESAPRRNWLGSFLNRLLLERGPARNSQILGVICSRALNYWGTRLQQVGELAMAEQCFRRALELNPWNVVANLNLECNRALRQHGQMDLNPRADLEPVLGLYRSLDLALNFNGPFDHPDYCYQLAHVFFRGGNTRQAAQNFHRVTQLAPTNPVAYLDLVQVCNSIRFTNHAWAIIQKLKTDPALQKALGVHSYLIPELEIQTYMAGGDIHTAEQLLRNTLASMPNNLSLLSLGMNFYVRTEAYSNALELANRILSIQPTNVPAIINKGFVLGRMQHHEQAAELFSQALVLQPENLEARLNRAITYLQQGNLDAAEADYKLLKQAYPAMQQVDYGLGEIAGRKGNTNMAVFYFKSYLSNAAPGSPDIDLVKSRLAELTGGQTPAK